jgi:predicted negative regulator of RcsB-dependent stress response
MKSVERHKLETNWLAKRLETSIEDARPHIPTIVGVIVAVAVVVVGWSWFSSASTGQEKEAWDIYNGIIGHTSLGQDSIKQLDRVAEEYQGTSMEELAKVTAADGQVWAASLDLLFDRKAATEALNRASSTYQTIIDSSSNEELVDRAHFGLGRVYELRNEPEKARAAYAKVTGHFARVAKFRSEELNKESTQKTLNWLATAEAQRPIAPLGAGTPGQRPDFGVDDLLLPNATTSEGGSTSPATGTAPPGETSLEELLKLRNQLPGEDNRYQTPEPEKSSAEPTADGGSSTAIESPALPPASAPTDQNEADK